MPRVLRAARRLIAISEFTKSEVVALVGIDPDRIEVIGVAAPRLDLRRGRLGRRRVRPPAVGTLEPRKNLAQAAEAARRAGVELRVAGARGWGDVTVNGIRWLGEVDDDELARLYRGARALVYPSRYEGFGIPILEAMQAGTPVVTSRGGATEEVAGGAAVLVDPDDPSSIAEGLAEADRRSDELRALGFARAREFSWDDVAERTLGVYEAARADRHRRRFPRPRPDRRRDVCRQPAARARPAEGRARDRGDRAGCVARPAGITPLVLPARSQELRMAWSVPLRLARVRPGSRTSSTRCRCSCERPRSSPSRT